MSALGNYASYVTPPSAEAEGGVRSLAEALRDAGRPVQPRKRVRGCAAVRIASNVAISSTCATSGLATCGSCWDCPVCSHKIRVGRAAEIQDAVRRWRASGPDATVGMLTLTIRHGLGDDLRRIRAGMGRAWSRLIRGAPWKRACLRWGMSGFVRYLEATHGENGWHPHFHVLVFLSGTPTDGQRAMLTQWIGERWRECVERELDKSAVPSMEHGAEFEVIRHDAKASKYLAKLGLELSSDFRKSARRKGKTPWQILDEAARGDKRSARLWHTWSAAMLGARMHTWSRGLRNSLRMGDEMDDQALAEQTEAEPSDLAAIIPGADWDDLRRRHGSWRVRRAAADGRICTLCRDEAQFDRIQCATERFREAWRKMQIACDSVLFSAMAQLRPALCQSALAESA